MISLGIKKKLIDDLSHLPFDSQKKVQEFAHALLITQVSGKSGKEMIKFSGILNGEDACELKQIIENGCGVRRFMGLSNPVPILFLNKYSRRNVKSFSQ